MINHNFRNATISTIGNYANLSISNDPKVECCNLSSSRLKSLGRKIASESARSLCSHVLMTIATQFRVRPWPNKPKKLSAGTETSHELSQHDFETDEVCPMDMRCLLSFDEHGYDHVSGGHKQDARRLLGKRSSNDAITDREEKNILQVGPKPR